MVDTEVFVEVYSAGNYHFARKSIKNVWKLTNYSTENLEV